MRSFFLIILFLLSRVAFANPHPVFFDSPEYLSRLSNPNFLNALVSGHLPLHAGYTSIFWPIFQLGKAIHIYPSSLVIFTQIILSLLAVCCFYGIIKIITNNKDAAFKAAVILSLLPLYWITNITIMMETAYVSFFIFSLYFLAKYCQEKLLSISPYLTLSALCLGIAFLAHPLIILWMPFLMLLVFILNKKRLISSLLYFSLSIFVFSLINAYFISIQNKANFLTSVSTLYTAKLGERAQFNFDVQSVFVYARNFVIPLLGNYTSLIVILTPLSMIKMYFKDKKILMLSLLWIFPSLIASQWWDSVLFGRHSLIAGFGLAFLTAYLIQKNRTLFLVTTIYLLAVSLPVLNLLRGEIPYLQEAKAIEHLPKYGLLIESHFARPQTDKMYKGTIVFVDEPGWEKEKLTSKINSLLKNGKPVFVSSSALSEPYGLYSGPYLHILSLSYRKDFVLKPIIRQFTLKEYKAVNRKDNLLIYQITSNKPSEYPAVKNMSRHRRKINYSDPLSRNLFFIP